MCETPKRLNILAVISAKAGIHNHRETCGAKLLTPSLRQTTPCDYRDERKRSRGGPGSALTLVRDDSCGWGG